MGEREIEEKIGYKVNNKKKRRVSETLFRPSLHLNTLRNSVVIARAKDRKDVLCLLKHKNCHIETSFR